MSDYDDRGAYTPPSDRLAFDPRTPVRGGGPAPVTLIVSGVVLMGLVGGVFFLYRDGFKHRSSEAPALVGAPVADARTPAAPPPADDNAAPSLVVDKTTAPPPAPAFAPPPAPALPAQAPPAQRLAAQPPAPATPVIAAASPPVALRPAPRPQVVMLAPDAPPKPAPQPKQVAALAPPKQAAVAPEHAVAPSAIRQTAAAAPSEHPVAHHTQMTIASLTDDALDHHARAARATRDDGVTRDVRQPHPRFIDAPPPPTLTAHRAVTKGAQFAAAPPPRMVAAAPATRMVAASGSGWVQIGAFSSPSLADQGWRDVARLEPGAMAGKGKAVQPIDRDDGTTLYRAYVTGFASVAAAQGFCSELKASGKACMVK